MTVTVRGALYFAPSVFGKLTLLPGLAMEMSKKRKYWVLHHLEMIGSIVFFLLWDPVLISDLLYLYI